MAGQKNYQKILQDDIPNVQKKDRFLVENKMNPFTQGSHQESFTTPKIIEEETPPAIHRYRKGETKPRLDSRSSTIPYTSPSNSPEINQFKDTPRTKDLQQFGNNLIVDAVNKSNAGNEDKMGIYLFY